MNRFVHKINATESPIEKIIFLFEKSVSDYQEKFIRDT